MCYELNASIVCIPKTKKKNVGTCRRLYIVYSTVTEAAPCKVYIFNLIYLLLIHKPKGIKQKRLH